MLHCEVVSARSQPASNLKIEEHTRGSTPMGILVQKKGWKHLLKAHLTPCMAAGCQCGAQRAACCEKLWVRFSAAHIDSERKLRVMFR